MKKHTRIWMAGMRYDKGSIPLCEVCGAVATDVHHVRLRGMGGAKNLDYFENLLGLCRSCHQACHSGAISKDFQLKIIEGRK
jgi:ferredoxin